LFNQHLLLCVFVYSLNLCVQAAAKVRALMAEYAAAVKVSSNDNAPRTGTARPKSVRIVEPVAATEDASPPPPADKPADSSDPAQPAEGANETSESPAAVPEPEPEVEAVDPAAVFHAKLLEMGAPVVLFSSRLNCTISFAWLIFE
jgi:uncharacterized membrane protein